jgi:mono/diheme cytochrome c family protein
MVLRSLSFSTGIFLFFSCGNGTGEGSNVQPVSGNKSTAEVSLKKGEEIYNSNCVACHGKDGTGQLAGAKDLQKSTKTYSGVIEIIEKGKNGMPSFHAMLSKDSDIPSVAKYVIELRK